jgi:ankyrin repeat protein
LWRQDEVGVREWLSRAPTHPDGPDGYAGTTALAHAASGGSSECVRLLLAARADVRLPRSPRANALHYAAFKMHRQVRRKACYDSRPHTMPGTRPGATPYTIPNTTPGATPNTSPSGLLCERSSLARTFPLVRRARAARIRRPSER